MRTHALLERLPQHLERAPVELRHLVEEQHAVVREADLAGARHAVRRRRARRPRSCGAARETAAARQQPRAGRQQPRDRMHGRGLERLVERQRRKDPGEPPRHHRLARARRTDQQQVVSAGRGDFERAAGERLPADVGEVRPRSRRAASLGAGSGAGSAATKASGSLSAATASVSESDRKQSQARRRPQLRRRCGEGRSRPAIPIAPRRRRDRQHPARRLDRRHRARARRGAAMSAMSRRLTSPVAARTPSAIGRSNDDPALRTSAGARLTVTRCGGNSKPEFRIALRTRSRLSRTLASGRPTIVKVGSPNDTSTSTWTGQASTPKTAAVRTQASTRFDPMQGGPQARITGSRWKQGASVEDICGPRDGRTLAGTAIAPTLKPFGVATSLQARRLSGRRLYRDARIFSRSPGAM